MPKHGNCRVSHVEAICSNDQVGDSLDHTAGQVSIATACWCSENSRLPRPPGTWQHQYFNTHEHLIHPLRSFQISSPEYCSGGTPSGGELFQGTAEGSGIAYALLIWWVCAWERGAHLALGKL